MKEGKHTIKKVKIFEKYFILILIAFMFMSIGYAKISDVILDINGTVEAIAQDGVFIKNATSETTGTATSKVNYYIETILDSEIDLGSSSSSNVTYQVTLYNNSSEEYVFIDTITDKTDQNINNNDNIEYSVVGLEKNVTTISPQGSLNCTVTFKYKDKENINNTTMKSRLNFRFKEIPKVVLSSEGEKYQLENIYPGYTSEGYQFTVSNYDSTKTNTVPMEYTFETTIDSLLTVKIYDSNGDEVTNSKEILGDGTTQQTHTYTLKIAWNNTEIQEYEDKEFAGRVTLRATPVDDKYSDYAITKQFSINVKTAPFTFNANPTTANITIKNDQATLALTMSNYTSNTNYNKFDTKYEISIEGNTDFTLNNATNGVIAKTLSGGEKIDDSFNMGFTADMSKLDTTENLTLKIVAKSPYSKVITIPVTINLHSLKVTLNANGGTVSPSSITVYQSKTYTGLPTPTWTGHVFQGWYTATTGGTKVTTATEVTTDAATQTLYAQWSDLLAYKVAVGDYVNYPVNYSNVSTDADGGYTPKTTYTGWRVLSIDGSGDNKYVRLVSAGIPLTYVHPKATNSGPTSVTALTTNFFSTAISSTSTNYKFRKCGFKNASGTTITTIAQLKTLFTNDYTQISSSTPKVQSMTKADFDLVYGSVSENGTYVTDNDLLAIPSQTSGSYAAYHLATYNTYSGYHYLWNVRYAGAIIFTNSEHGIRPVVTLKTSVETSGKVNGVWQVK